MGRIEEALKRSRGNDGESVVGTIASPGTQVFRDAWTTTDEAPPPRHEVRPALPEGPMRPALPELPTRPGPPDRKGLLRFSSQWRERLASGPDGDVRLTEQFRRLAATLHHAKLGSGLRDVMLTSASPGDGKTLTAVNLALVLAESYHYKVLLIDADLRRPSIPNIGDVSDGCGLSEALTAQNEQRLALAQVTPRLTLLPAGRPISNSVEALTSPRMRQILEEASHRFDWVILDAPPVSAATDARLLSQMVGGTLFVIHAGQSQLADVQKSVEAIGRDQILGVVLNAVEDDGDSASYYYGPVA